MPFSHCINSTTVCRAAQAGARPKLQSVGAAPPTCSRSTRGGKLDAAQQTLARAQQAFEKAQDNLGIANCLMTAGDWLGAPSSSSLVWNLILQDSSSEASELAINTETAEFLRPDKDALVQAADLYRRAAELYAKAEAPRGIASIGLRHGYSRCSTTITRRRLHTPSARKNTLYARVICGKRICFPLLRLNSTARL